MVLVKARILVVDDDEVSCRLFTEVLEGEGHEVHKRIAAKKRSSDCAANLTILLLVDVRMPGITGLDVTRTVRQEQPQLPVIVMTAFGSIETAVEAIHEGAFDYVSKPMNLDELKKIVSRALDRENWTRIPTGRSNKSMVSEQQKT